MAANQMTGLQHCIKGNSAGNLHCYLCLENVTSFQDAIFPEYPENNPGQVETLEDVRLLTKRTTFCNTICRC